METFLGPAADIGTACGEIGGAPLIGFGWIRADWAKRSDIRIVPASTKRLFKCSHFAFIDRISSNLTKTQRISSSTSKCPDSSRAGRLIGLIREDPAESPSISQ